MTNTHRTVEVPLVLPVRGGSGGRGLGNVQWSRTEFGEDVVAWYRAGGPEVELSFPWFDMDDNAHAVSKHMTPAQAYALAQRLLSAVEATSHTPGSRPMETKPAVDQEVSDAAAIDSLLRDVVKSKQNKTQNTTSLKIHLIKTLRWSAFGDAGLRASEHDARLSAVLRLWDSWPGYDLPPGPIGGLRLAKLVVESWMERNGIEGEGVL